jgi:hemerythrin
VEFLHNWWIRHIFEEDMEYREYFRRTGSKSSDL